MEQFWRCYNSLTSTTKANFQSPFSAFEHRFDIGRKNILTRLQELNQKMTNNESIADYARRREDIFDKLGITDEATKVNTFVQLLKSETDIYSCIRYIGAMCFYLCIGVLPFSPWI